LLVAFATANHLLQNKQLNWDWNSPWDILANLKEKIKNYAPNCEQSSHEKINKNYINSKSTEWQRILNATRKYFENELRI
jgi:hypothetical protein